MGSFLAAIGGAGNAAIPYGEQMRSQLEARRHDFASLIGKAAQEESDPQTRTSLLQHQADLLAGKPIGSVAQKFQSTMQKLHKDNEALTNVFGGPPKEPAPVPGAAPGVTPGQPIAPITPQRVPSPFEGYIAAHAQDQTPPAAQPATNPIAGPQGPIQASPVTGAVTAPAASPQIPSIAAAQPQPALAPIPQPIAPVANDPRAMRSAIIQRYHDAYQQATPAMRPMVLSEMNDSLAQLQPFEQVAQRKAEFETFSQTPEFKNLPPFAQAAYAAQAHGYQPVNMPQGMLVPNKIQTTVDALDAATRKQFGLEGLPNGFPVIISRSRSDNSIMDATPGNPGIAVTTNPDGTQSFTSKTPGTSAGVAAPIATRIVSGGVDAQGHPLFINPFHAGTPVVGPGVNPGFVPSHTTSTVQTPGALPVTTTSTRTKGGIMSIAGTPAPSAPPSKVDPVVKRKYDDWVAGASVPTGKDLTAVQDYASKNNLPSPVALSAAGQKIMESVDSTTKQIDGLLDRLRGIQGRTHLTPEYVKYQLGGNTQYNDIFSGTAFTDLRSAAAALQGVSARGEKVLREGLAHTPTFDRLGGFLPDDIKTMIGKFEEAKKLIAGDKESALRNMTKTGIVAMPQASPVIAPIQTAPIEVERGPDGKLKIKGQ